MEKTGLAGEGGEKVQGCEMANKSRPLSVKAEQPKNEKKPTGKNKPLATSQPPMIRLDYTHKEGAD